MPRADMIWKRIKQHAGADFRTATCLPFICRVPGEYLLVTRNDAEINRSLSRTNFELALAAMPASGPGALKERQGPSCTWAILMDSRIRQHDW